MDTKKNKIGILTFHASHNYGSCLQAYALQKTIEKLGADTEIINFRTDRQRDMYAVFTKRKGIKYFIKNATHLLYYNFLKKKHANFEAFIANNYTLSAKEYKNYSQLEQENFGYDAFVVGSDQIWNPIPKDFDMSYFLPFVKDKKKIAYAPSFGPFFEKIDDEKLSIIANEVSKFDSISVREISAKHGLEKYISKDVDVVVDPTLLLNKDEWAQLINEKPVVEGEYIFLYTLFSNPEINKVAKYLSKKWKTKVVVSNFTNQHDVISCYEKKFDAGPKEFLNLICNAKFVLATSFHGTVFSILFNKPFFAINGEKDNRISTLLNLTKLQSRTINMVNMDERERMAFDTDFSMANQLILEERERSIKYLQTALGL